MKYSGIDGVLIDWYGTRQVNDYYANLLNSNALINQTSGFDLNFGIVYEDWTVNYGTSDLNTRINLAKADMTYIKTNYYNRSNYIKINNKNVFLLPLAPEPLIALQTGPVSCLSTANKPLILPLAYRKNDVGYRFGLLWVDPNYNSYLSSFYNRSLNVTTGSAFPGFNDFYAEGARRRRLSGYRPLRWYR